tara:strand:+ start:962 stop:1288 length:327 start_codon:yes stop_codon:yes gene_type:complete
MNNINEDKMCNAVIEFKNEINEEYLKNFAYSVKEILKAMVTGKGAPISVKGDASKVRSFAKALGNELEYIKVLGDTKIDDPRAMAQRHKLEASVSDFESMTGIKWPVR